MPKQDKKRPGPSSNNEDSFQAKKAKCGDICGFFQPKRKPGCPIRSKNKPKHSFEASTTSKKTSQCTTITSKTSISLMNKSDGLFAMMAAVGIHDHNCASRTENTFKNTAATNANANIINLEEEDDSSSEEDGSDDDSDDDGVDGNDDEDGSEERGCTVLSLLELPKLHHDRKSSIQW